MNVPPERSVNVERERRLMRPAGIAAIVGSIAFQIGLYVGGEALAGDSTSERLLEASKGDADGQLLLGVVTSGLGFVLMGAALTHLFIAARARSPRVLRQLVALPLAGAVMVAGGLVLNNISYLDAADSFAASEAEREAAPAEPEAEQKSEDAAQKPDGAGGDERGDKAQGEAGADEKTSTVEPTTSTAATTTETSAAESEEDAEDAADERADDALADASGSAASALLVRGGALAFAIGFFYTALWSMRTGLLSRFWGSLGMASAVVLALFFLYFFALIWFLALGMLLAGAWVGGRPPAWEAGTAIPWPKPGEPPPDARDPLAGQDQLDSVEGEGREVERGETDDSGPDDAPREPPQKRKRRR